MPPAPSPSRKPWFDRYFPYLRLLRPGAALSKLGKWAIPYRWGLRLFGLQFFVALAVTVLDLLLLLPPLQTAEVRRVMNSEIARRLYELLLSASHFFWIAFFASLVVLGLALLSSVSLAWVARSMRSSALIDLLGSPADLPLVFWVFLLLPAIFNLSSEQGNASTGQELFYYGLMILILVLYWSVFEITREVIRQSREPFVASLRNLGFSETQIYFQHILAGRCREFVMAHIFNMWMLLLLIEIAVGFAAQYARVATELFLVPLETYDHSFGALLAKDLRFAHEQEAYLHGLQDLVVLAIMFSSYWLIQVGILSVRQAGGLEYLEALSKSDRGW